MRIAEGVFLHADASNCYVLRDGREAVLIDIGSGDVLDHLADYGVDRVTDVLMTHHHRDGAQGLARAAALGIRIHVPPSERDLFAAVDDHWQGRPLDNNYDLREDRFSILESVPVTAVVREYHWAHYGSATLLALPTPGHTLGSITYFADIDGRRLAFTGDLIAGPGKVWSLASMQWSYTGMEGVPATMISTLSVLDHRPDLLLPAHGSPMDDPVRAVALLNERLQRLIDERIPGWRPTQLRELPFEELSPHLLRNRTSQASVVRPALADRRRPAVRLRLRLHHGAADGLRPLGPPAVAARPSARSSSATASTGSRSRSRPTTTTTTWPGSTSCARWRGPRSGRPRT